MWILLQVYKACPTPRLNWSSSSVPLGITSMILSARDRPGYNMGIHGHYALILCTLCKEWPRQISFESTGFHASQISVDNAFQFIITRWNALHVKTLSENSTLTVKTSLVLTNSDTATTGTINTGIRSSFWKYAINLPTKVKNKSLFLCSSFRAT